MAYRSLSPRKTKECGHEVSDTAQNCPNCGADIQQQIFDSLSPEEQREVLAPRKRILMIYEGIAVVGLLGMAIILLGGGHGMGFFPLLLALVIVIVYIQQKKKGNL